MCVIPGFPVIVVAWLRRGSDLVVTVVVVVWLRRGATCWFAAVVAWLAVQVMLDLPEAWLRRLGSPSSLGSQMLTLLTAMAVAFLPASSGFRGAA